MVLKNAIDAAERIIDVVRHKNSALHIDHQRAETALAAPLDPAAARSTVRIVRRAQKTALVLQIRIDFLLFPDVIPGGKDVNASGEHLFGALDVHAHAAGGILYVGNDQIDRFSFY